jgi:uncharacterized tellurite resistance protein B-like protein
MGILEFLGLNRLDSTNVGQEDIDSIRRISKQMEELEPQRARFLAAFAYLLGRVANADRNISPEESRTMEEILVETGNLPREQAVMTIEIAKRQNRLFGHVENFLVTREFNELANRQQKMELLDCLFSVCASDRRISSSEDTEIRQIASELLLDHRDFIDIRSKYRNYLDVLQKHDLDA